MRLIFLTLGHACLIIGIIGIPVPILPTTPFLLLAAFFYSRGSKHFHDWLHQHPRLGPAVRDWQDNGVIRPRAKLLATIAVAASLTYPLVFGDMPTALKIIAGIVGAAVLTFIHSRPSESRERRM